MKDFDRLHSILNNISEMYSDEDGPALVFSCETGKGRTTVAMAIASLIFCNKKGFPAGTKVEEQDPACVPNAKYTMGEFSVSKSTNLDIAARQFLCSDEVGSFSSLLKQ